MVVVVVLVGAAAALVWGLTRPSTEVGSATYGACGPAGDPGRRPLAGFGEVAFRVEAVDGGRVRGCALLAETPEARATGMMGQRDLRGYDAMAFRFPEPVTGGFYMFRTVVPLSIAFVDPAGEVVSTADMAPCPAGVAAECPTYSAGAPYRHALEVLEGGLDRLGLAPGADVAFGADAPG